MNENENSLICPLRAAICYGDSCAWYMQGCRRCAQCPGSMRRNKMKTTTDTRRAMLRERRRSDVGRG